MKFVLYTNSVSAHQLPLARELVKRIGEENFRYVYTGENLQHGCQEVAEDIELWVVKENGRCSDVQATVQEWLENAEVMLVGGIRPWDLIERRLKRGKTILYQSERWFKPIPLPFFSKIFCRHTAKLQLPGWMRMWVPSYRRMVKRFVKMANGESKFRVLSIGPWARRDFLQMGVRVDKIVDWGYFVAASDSSRGEHKNRGGRDYWTNEAHRVMKVLWVGRMLDWKRVDTLIRAVARANVLGKGKCAFTLTVVGDGPEELYLRRLAAKVLPTQMTFKPRMSIAEVRLVMREHDVYVLPSNAREGWGAALSEAMEESMICFGTCEAGASAALLPVANHFHSGDDQGLARLLVNFAISGSSRRCEANQAYTPKGAADRILDCIYSTEGV